MENIYRADLEDGDGIAEIAGHKVYPIFAFTESSWNARIFIVSYPGFMQISVFESKEECVYIGLAFSETEHLIALTGMPNYKLQVFFWRTHDMLISEETEIITDKQKITCSYSQPLTVCQFAYSRGEMIIHEVHGTLKFCKLIKRKIDLNFLKMDGPFQDVYSVEGNVLIVNKHGEIFHVIPSTGIVSLIARYNGEKGSVCDTCITYIRNGALVAGTDGNLKYFKRQKFVWSEIFQTLSTHPFVSLSAYQDNELAVGTTRDGGLYKLSLMHDGEKLQVTKIHQYDPVYTSFVLIYPRGSHLVTVNVTNEIHVFHVETGEKISEILQDVTLNQIILKANPIFPFVAIGNSSGNVYCISLLDPINPTHLTEFLLSRQSIQAIRFSNDGNYLIVNDMDSNHFVISCTPGEKMSVLHHFKEDTLAIEFFAIESRTTLELVLLTKSNSGSNDKILKFSIHLNELEREAERNEWELAAFYNTIIPIFGSTEKFYAIRKNSKIVEVLQLDNEAVTLVDFIRTPHQMKYLNGWNDGHHLVTWSIDGIVAIYNLHKNHQLISCFVAANRHNFGVKKVKCDPEAEYVIALDHSGNLICSSLNIKKSDEELQIMHDELSKFETLVDEKFSKPTSGGFPTLSQEHQGTKKYTDLKDEKAYQMEAEESEDTRVLLYKKIEGLRGQVKKLLDENEQNDDSEKLEIQEFNLDLGTTVAKEQDAQDERDQQDKKMMDYIEAQSAMNQYLIDKCWNHLAVKGTKLRGMFHNMYVENYPLLPDKGDNYIERIQLIRSIENSVSREDAFLAWRPISTM